MSTTRLSTVIHQIRALVAPPDRPDTSDADLLARFVASRDEAAFTSLLRRHGPMVLAIGRRILRDRHEAEDIYQATFLLLTMKAGTIRQQASLASWLHGVAHRLALRARTQALRRAATEHRHGNYTGDL